MNRFRSFLISGASTLFFSLSFHSCGLFATGPKYEMGMADMAFNSAREAKANIHAPNLYRKAELNCLKAKSSYRRKYFVKAKEYAELCVQYSEQAEFAAQKKTVLEGK